MSYRSALLAALAAVTVASALNAEPLKPVQAQKVDLGALSGVAYYTAEPDGHRLVVTLQARETDTPFRFVATLAPGQAVTLSIARNLGEPAEEIHFVGRGEQLLVSRGGAGPYRGAAVSE